MKNVVILILLFVFIGACNEIKQDIQVDVFVGDPVIDIADPVEEVSEPISICPKNSQHWLAIGQSNMRWQYTKYQVGLDDSDVEVIQYERDNINNANVSEWTPLHEVTSFAWVPGSFAQGLSDHLGNLIKIIGLAIDGTELSCWHYGSCYEDHIERFAGDVDFDGVIWWQGEGDYFTGDPDVVVSYGDRLLSFFDDLRKDLGNEDLPIIIVALEKYCKTGSLSGGDCDEPESWAFIRQEQLRVASEDPLVWVVDAEDITNGDVHPTEDYHEIGMLMADVAHQEIYNSCEIGE